MTVDRRLLTLALLAVVAAVFYPVLSAPLCYLDDERLIDGLLNTDTLTLSSPFVDLRAGTYYRPVAEATFIADKLLWGLDESFMHLENVLLHLVNVFLLLVVSRRLFPRWGVDGELPPLLAALLFGLHPVNVEAVAWISGRTDLLAACFVLSSLSLLLVATGRRSVMAALAAVAVYFVGTLAKETTLFFLPVAAFVLWDRALQWKTLREKIIFLGMVLSGYAGATIFYFALRRAAFFSPDLGVKGAIAGVTAKNGADPLATLGIIVKATGFYAKKLLFPFPLNFALVQVSNWYIPAGILVLLLAVYLLSKRTGPGILLAAALCVGASAFLVAIGKVTWTPFAERYLYLPSAFFCAGITAFAVHRFRKTGPRFGQAVAVMAISVAAIATMHRNFLWQDPLAFTENAFLQSPNFAPVRQDYARALMESGREKEALAVIENTRVEEFQPSSMNMIIPLLARKDYDGAASFLKARLEQKRIPAHIVLAKLCEVLELKVRSTQAPDMKRKYREEYVMYLQKLSVSTGDPFHQYRLGQEMVFLGKPAEAARYFAAAYAVAPAGAYYRAAAGKLAQEVSK